MRVIRSTELNATTRIRARQKLPTIIERLRKRADNLFFTDGDLFLRTFTCGVQLLIFTKFILFY